MKIVHTPNNVFNIIHNVVHVCHALSEVFIVHCLHPNRAL